MDLLKLRVKEMQMQRLEKQFVRVQRIVNTDLENKMTKANGFWISAQ